MLLFTHKDGAAFSLDRLFNGSDNIGQSQTAVQQRQAEDAV